jgi:RNA recognition motif-containing protein
MSGKLHVGNLDTRTTAETLSQAFQAEGRQVVSVKLVMSRDPKHSRGFAFVEMATAADAEAAVAALDGAEIEGRRVRVSVANAPKSRFGGPY